MGQMLRCLLKISLLAILAGCGGGGGGGGSSGGITAPVKQEHPLKVIVTIGDSETAGAVSIGDTFVNKPESSYPAKLQELLKDKALVHNLGINSSNILEVYNDQVPKAITLNPDILIISTTLNDAGDSLSNEQVGNTLSLIKLAMPKTRVILLTPLKAHKSVVNIVEYRNRLYTYGLEVFDIASYSNESWYCGNVDFHPCEDGYLMMARAIRDYLSLR